VYFETAEITGKTPDDEWMFLTTNLVILILFICTALAAALQATTAYQLCRFEIRRSSIILVCCFHHRITRAADIAKLMKNYLLRNYTQQRQVI
jgi:hypothetical protein